METQFRRTEQFDSHSVEWWMDLKAVLYDHGITDAKELEIRLSEKPPSVADSFVSACSTAKRMVAAGFIKEPISQPDPPKLPRPTIGRIVHFIDRDGLEWPAIIVAISSFTPDQWVYLKAFVWGDRRADISDFAMHDENKKTVRTWHWPEREGKG